MKKRIILLTVIFAVLFSGVYAYYPEVKATFTELNITLNGNKINLKDTNGNLITPIVVNGTTYLPVRSISESLGLTVDWNGLTKTISLNSNSKSPSKKQEAPIKSTNKSKTNYRPSNSDYFGKGDTWETDEWRLTVHSVKSTNERNEFLVDDPIQVVIINYSFENINYNKGKSDLYLSIDNVVDEENNVCSRYLGFTKAHKYTPVGSKTNGEVAYGLITPSNTIKIYFTKYDSNSKKQKAIFELPVE